MVWRIVLWLLSKFDAEDVHHFTIRMMRLFSPLIRSIPLPRVDPRHRVHVGGIEFHHPLGLAAGFDKNAEILDLLPSFGFSFAEIGTVTPKPQEGNDRPRLFRDIVEKKIFNRMGFNNLGAGMIAQGIREKRRRLPSWFKVGVNLGKNRNTSLAEAENDYAQALLPFQGLVDFAVINISSPNTQGLRDLQAIEAIKRIGTAVLEAMRGWERPIPVFLKLSPELSIEEIGLIEKVCREIGVQAIILTNTLKGHHNGMDGGWSGSVLTVKAREHLKAVATSDRLPVISVGGILSEEEASRRLIEGAKLIEIYSGWIFGGPCFPRKILGKL